MVEHGVFAPKILKHRGTSVANEQIFMPISVSFPVHVNTFVFKRYSAEYSYQQIFSVWTIMAISTVF